MQDRLLIVDGHNLLFQMFFGMPARIVNKSGKPIQGVIGFVGALNKMLKWFNPKYTVVLFDGEHGNSRLEILDSYKGNRLDYSEVEEEFNPFSQLPFIYAALDFMNIKHIEVEEDEADDVISSYVYKCQEETKIIIASFDSDFFQLINENVEIFRYRGNNSYICDATYLFNKYKIAPRQYAFFKSLVGDSADNIKGIKKIGIKTAAKLVNQFADINDLYLRIDDLKNEVIKDNLLYGREDLLRNFTLIKLGNQSKVPFPLFDLIYAYKDITTTDILKGINIY